MNDIRKKFIRLFVIPTKYIYPLVILIIVLGGVRIYYWQHAKVKQADNLVNSLKTQNKTLINNMSGLSKQVANDQYAIKAKSVPRVYHIGDTQCINDLCITLDSFTQVPETLCSSCSPNTNLWHAELAVTNNGKYPLILTSKNINPYLGIFSGSLVYTNDNLFWGAFQAGSGGASFVNTFSDYPKTGQTINGSLAFLLPSSEIVDSFLYGNLTWQL